MSYDSFEISNYDAKPINLYEFSIGGTYWRYSSDEVDTPFLDPNHGAVIYSALAISDSGVIQSGDAAGADLTVTLPASAQIAQVFNVTPPSDETWLVVRRKQHADAEAPITWIGTVNSYGQTQLKAARFVCRTMLATFNRNGARLSYGRQCPHALYDSLCRATKSSHGVVFIIETMGGNWLGSTALNGYAANWFAGGFIEFGIIGGATERRAVAYSDPGFIELLGGTDGMTVGSFIAAFPGCNRTTSDCNGKFNNLANFGGFPHLPGKSPFDGDPIF